MDFKLLRPAAPFTYTPVGGGGDDGAPLTSLLTQFSNIALTAQTYTLSTQLKIPSASTIKGAGVGKTIIKLAAGTGNTLTNDGWIRNTDFTNGNNDILLEDFEVDGNRSNRTRSSSTDDNNIFFQGSTTSLVCNRIGMNRVYSHSSNGQGVIYRYCNDSWMDHVKSNDNGRNNTDLVWNGIYWLRCVKGTLNACRADSQNDRSGFKISDCQQVTSNQCSAFSNPVYGFEGGDPTGDIFPDTNIFNECIAGSNTLDGFNYNLSSGNAKRIWWIACASFLNGNNGLVTNNITGGGILGGSYYNNATGASWQGARIQSTTRFQIKGGQFYDDQGSPTQTNGIFLVSGNDYITIENADVRGNASTGLVQNTAGDNTHGWYKNCPGFNAVGVIASPYDNTGNFIGSGPANASGTLTSAKTYTCIHVPLDLYLAGGTVTNVTKNGSTLCTSLPAANAAPLAVHLEPTDTFSITFSVTPTTAVVMGE